MKKPGHSKIPAAELGIVLATGITGSCSQTMSSHSRSQPALAGPLPSLA